MMKKAFKDITGRLSELNRLELRELKAIIEALLLSFEKEQTEVIKNRYATQGGKGSQGGYIERKKIKGFGPYLYLRYWSGDVHKSVYIGKAKS